MASDRAAASEAAAAATTTANGLSRDPAARAMLRLDPTAAAARGRGDV